MNHNVHDVIEASIYGNIINNYFTNWKDAETKKNRTKQHNKRCIIADYNKINKLYNKIDKMRANKLLECQEV